MLLRPNRLLALSVTATMLCVATAAHADEWVVYESDAGIEAEDELGELDEPDDLGAGPSGPSKGPAKGPSGGPAKGAACNCDVPGDAFPSGLASLGLLGALPLLAYARVSSRLRRRSPQRGGRA